MIKRERDHVLEGASTARGAALWPVFSIPPIACSTCSTAILDAGDGRVIEALYRDMDRLVGETWKHVDSDTALFVLSDHGFCSFRRGVNLNAWLHKNGYLALLDGAEESGDYFEGVDWSRTRAYTFGLGGLYLNLKGREAGGIVSQSEPVRSGRNSSRNLPVCATRKGGQYPQCLRCGASTKAVPGRCPDLIVGYAAGYRTSWRRRRQKQRAFEQTEASR
jgi:hypothetical protein